MKYLVKTHVRVGEVAIDMGLLNAINLLDPDCHLEVLATSPAHALLEETPFIDKLHVRQHVFIKDFVLQTKLLFQRWDVVLSTRLASRLQLFHFLAIAKHKKTRRYMDTPEGLSEMQIRQSMLRGVLEGWDEPVDPTIHYDHKREGKVAERLGMDPNNKILVIAPGASQEAKRWHKDKFIALAKSLADKFDVITVIGSKDEHLLCEHVAVHVNAVNLAGKLGLLDLCAFLSFASLLIGNDSGPCHLAAGVGTRCLAIGDESGPRYKPYKQHMILGNAKDISFDKVTKYLVENRLVGF